jgi:hypothetical protein
VQRGLHEVADEKIVEDLVLQRAHQRMARHLESHPAIEAAPCQRDHVVAAADAQVHEVEEAGQVLDRAEVAARGVEVLPLEGFAPVIAELRRRHGGFRKRGRIDGAHAVGAQVIADEGRQDAAALRVEARGVLLHAGGACIRPGAVLALIAVHGAERDEVADAEGLGAARDRRAERHAGALALQRRRLDALSVLVEEIDHVRVVEPGEAQQERALVLLHQAGDERHPAVPGGIVGVHHQRVADLDQEHRVLLVVGQAHDMDAGRERHPARGRQLVHVVALAREILADAAAGVRRDEDAPAAQQGQRIAVEVVGMAVREPYVSGAQDRRLLLRRHRVRQAPAAEIGRAGDPGIGGQHRLAVESDQGGVADGFETEIHPWRLLREARFPRLRGARRKRAAPRVLLSA